MAKRDYYDVLGVPKNATDDDVQQLIDAVTALETHPTHDERDHLAMKSCIAKLHLVQPFDWMHWTEPFPEPEQAKLLDLETAIKHITRICRAERFYENSIWSHIRSGLLMGLCLVVRQHTRGEIVRNVFENTN